MNDRKNKIINYFIILQIFQYKREVARSFFMRYIQVLNKRIEDCIFDLDNKDKDIYKNLTHEIKSKAEACFEKYENQIIFIEDDIFPNKVKNTTEHPIVLFYEGNLDLLKNVSLSIVGTRNPSERAVTDTIRITKFLISKNICIVSGLAKGIDVTTHNFCFNAGYKNIIAVIGTPLKKYYPKENRVIQEYIEKNGLLITEFADFEPTLKWNFLRRNYIMSSISDSTIVMQAGDTSGTVSQARSTLKNGKSLFVPASVFDDPYNSWPHNFKKEYTNVYKFNHFDDLKRLLKEKLGVE
ncbi:MAG: DNA-protecting protein DprA [Anaeroplasmataceae bacterium]|nr:DNA-protecting protein DprA [Anaeroplasmataceae bacterium]